MTVAAASAWIDPRRWDVLVVGGGHAGAEAALAAVRMGCQVLLVTASVDRIGWMSCNPSVGGVGKTHLVAEVDALGGEMARNADRACIHAKLLHQSRGPAVQALRAQCDKLEYATSMRERLEQTAGLQILQGSVAALWLDRGVVCGVVTAHGVALAARAVVLTTGTFLAAVCHVGDQREAGGRAGEGAAQELGAQLRALGLRTLRHKTGTCPRVDARSIDWAATVPDHGLTPAPAMARGGTPPPLPQMACHATHTTHVTHELIRAALPRSPLFGGQIVGRGPRYCPSIEDKVVRFAERGQHTLFLEREGWRTQEVYVSGLSTSLPVDVQAAMVRSIPGLERASIVRFGYAVEYDTIDPRQLGPDLGLPTLPGLYFAGQVNGTSGYEEAAAQGVWAGAAAACHVQGRALPRLSRADAYLAVLVDDLLHSGGEEPYRMLTSRAEHRLHLRCGNADLRMFELGAELGLLDQASIARVRARRARLQEAGRLLARTRVSPTPAVSQRLEAAGVGGLHTVATLAELLRRPGLAWETVTPWLPEVLRDGGALALRDDDIDELVVAERYASYQARERTRMERTRRSEAVALDPDMDFYGIAGLSHEACQRLVRARPQTLGAASRVQGVTPAAVAALHVHVVLQRRRHPPAPARPDPTDGAAQQAADCERPGAADAAAPAAVG